MGLDARVKIVTENRQFCRATNQQRHILINC
jgi:hypothetical protein